MAARPEVFTRQSGVHSLQTDADARPAAIVLALRRTDSQGRKLVGETSGDRLGPAQGLVIGLALGAVFWLTLWLLAWGVFHP